MVSENNPQGDTMHPYIAEQLMTERTRERREVAASWYRGEVRLWFPLRVPRRRPTWRTRTV